MSIEFRSTAGRIVWAACAALPASAAAAPVQHDCPSTTNTIVTCDVDIAWRDSASSQGSIGADVWHPFASSGRTEVAANRNERQPLIIYVPGWGGVRSNNTAGLSSLARRGYFVVAIDDIARDKPFADPIDEASRRADFDLDSDAIAQRFIEAADHRVQLQGEKLRRLIDGLSDGYTSPDGQRLHPRIDLSRIGILGGSFGGATAAERARKDRRIGAIVNLDGWQFGRDADAPVDIPFLIVDSKESKFQSEWLTSPKPWKRNAAQLNAKEHKRQARQAAGHADTYRVLLTGAVHSDFTDDLATWSRFRSRWISLHGPSISASRARVILDDLIGDFFDVSLRGGDTGEVRRTIARYPELRDLQNREMP